MSRATHVLQWRKQREAEPRGRANPKNNVSVRTVSYTHLDVYKRQGYNGLPMGCSDDEFPWAREGEDPLETKYVYTTPVSYTHLHTFHNYCC